MHARIFGLFSLLLVLSLAIAEAADQLNWQPVTHYADSTPLSASDQAALRYRIYVGTSETTLVATKPDVVSPPVPVSTVPGLISGSYFSITTVLPGGEGAKGAVTRYMTPGQVQGGRIESAP